MKFTYLLTALAFVVACAEMSAKKVTVRDDVFIMELDTTTKTATITDCVGKHKENATIVIPDDILFEDGKTYKVTAIGKMAFLDCTLKDIVFPKGLKTIGESAFYNCPNFRKGKALEIPDGVETIGPLAFCFGKFTSLSIPPSVSVIKEQAFYDCEITSVSFSLPKTELRIGKQAFDGCARLTTVALPSRLTYLGEYAFYACTALKSASLPGTLSTIPNACFTKCSALTSVIIPNGVTTIKWAAFSQTGLTSVKLPSTLRTIGSQAFEYTSIANLVIPEGVTSIGLHAFGQCLNLQAVHLPASLTTMEDEIFINAKKLMKIQCDNPTPPAVGAKSFSEDTYLYAELIIPQKSFDLYRTARTWKDFRWFSRAGVEGVGADPESNDAPAVYYDLNGRLVENPSAPGIYIRRQGNVSTKVVL